MIIMSSFTSILKQKVDRPQKDDTCSSPYTRTYRILEDLYDKSPTLHCTVSGKGIILDCNDTYLRRMGFLRAESIGMSIFDQIDPNSLVVMHEYLEMWQKEGNVVNYEIWLRRKDGKIFPALLSAVSVHDEYGNVIACNIEFIDQTDIYKTKKDIEKTNEELRLKEKLKNEFIAIASHELRTPIQPLLGYAVLAKKGKIGQEEAWDGVLKEARRLQQLANDILDVSRIESDTLPYQMEKASINDMFISVADSAKANLPRDVSMEVVVDEASKQLHVDLDRSRITQVFSNVIGNAIKFTQKGSIKVECCAFVNENKIEIKVSDTGTGIPKQVLPNLFGKFITNSVGETDGHGGTGLGLFISKAIVTAHKGKIYAYNRVEGGATFTIVLPIDQSKIISD